MTIRQSSIDSYNHLLLSKMIGNQEHVILVAMIGREPTTRTQLEAITGLRINTISGRVNGLLKKNLIKETGRGICPITNRLVGLLLEGVE